MNLLREIFRLVGYDLRPLRRSHADARQHVAFVLRHFEVNCVVDVGANRGQFAASLRKLGYHGRIASFEPVDSSFQALRAKSEGDAEWRVFDCALGEVEERRAIRIHRRSDISSFREMRPEGRKIHPPGKADVVGTREVEIKTLAAVWPQVVEGLDEPRVFLKMDTQGFDDAVFRGAAPVCDRIVGLMSELSPTPLYEGVADYVELLQAYRAAGFELSGVYPVARLVGRARLAEMDCIMVRE